MDHLAHHSHERPPHATTACANDVEALPSGTPVSRERLPLKSVSPSASLSDDSTSDDSQLEGVEHGRAPECLRRFRFSIALAFLLQLFVVLAAFAGICAMFVVSSERQMEERAHILSTASLLNGANQLTSTIRQHSIVLSEMMVTAVSMGSFAPYADPRYLNESWVRSTAAPRYSLFRPPMLGKPSVYQLYEVCGMHMDHTGHESNVSQWYATGCNRDYCYYCNEFTCWNSMSRLNASFADVKRGLPVTGGLLSPEFVAAPIVVQNRSRLFVWNVTPSFSLSQVKQQWTQPYYETSDDDGNVSTTSFGWSSSAAATADGGGSGNESKHLLISLMQCTFFNATTNQCNHAFGVDMKLSYVESVVREVTTTPVSTTALVDLRSQTVLASNIEDKLRNPTNVVGRAVAWYLRKCPCHSESSSYVSGVDDDEEEANGFPCEMSVAVDFEEKMLAFQRIEPFGGNSVSFLLVDITPREYYTQGPRREMFKSIAVIISGCLLCLVISSILYYSIASPVKLLVKNFYLASRFRNDEVVIQSFALSEMRQLFVSFAALNSTLADAKPFLPQCILALASKVNSGDELDSMTRASFAFAPGVAASRRGVAAGGVLLSSPDSNPIEGRNRELTLDDERCETAEIVNAPDEVLTGSRTLSSGSSQACDGDGRSADGGILSVSAGSAALSTPRRSSLSNRLTVHKLQSSTRIVPQTSLGLPMVTDSSPVGGGGGGGTDGEMTRNQRRKVSFEMKAFRSVPMEAGGANVSSNAADAASSTSTSSVASDALAKRKARMRSLLSSCLREQLARKNVTVLFGNAVRFHDLCREIGANEATAAFDLVLRSLEDNAAHYGGVIDWFHGDRVMLTFGASSLNDHHARSCGEVLRGVTSYLRHRIRHACSMSFGVATGAALCGYTGTATMRRFSTIGPVVSYAAQITEFCRKEIPNTTILANAHAATDIRHVMNVEPCAIVSLCNGRAALGPQLAQKSGSSKPGILFRVIPAVCDENGLPFSEEEETERRQLKLSLFGALSEGRVDLVRNDFERSRETLGSTFVQDFDRELLRYI